MPGKRHTDSKNTKGRWKCVQSVLMRNNVAHLIAVMADISSVPNMMIM